MKTCNTLFNKMIIGFLFLLLSIAVDCVKIKKDRGNCSTLECPWSSSCVNGKCEKLARLPCDWQTKCPAELPVCWRNLCAATKHTFLSCENINEIDLASFVPMAVGRHKAAFGGTIGDGDDALAVVVKSVVEPTARRRQMFLRSAIEELDVLTDLGDAAQEFLPRYYGGCLRDDQLFPVTVHEYLPICFDTLLQLNVPWCTRLALAIRIFKLLAYFSRTRNGAAVLCDLKIDQICFDKTLTPKLVDLNQIHVNVTDDRPFNGGTKCKFAASDGGSDNRKTTVTNAADNPNNNVVASNASAAADDDDNKNYDDDDDNSADVDDDFDNAKRQCFTKCFTSFHRDFPDLIMDEEICQKNNRCPGKSPPFGLAQLRDERCVIFCVNKKQYYCIGYTFASNVFVYCHLIFKPLLSLPDLPNSTLAVIQSTFEQVPTFCFCL